VEETDELLETLELMEARVAVAQVLVARVQIKLFLQAQAYPVKVVTVAQAYKPETLTKRPAAEVAVKAGLAEMLLDKPAVLVALEHLHFLLGEQLAV
jgi:hypothetical protein